MAILPTRKSSGSTRIAKSIRESLLQPDFHTRNNGIKVVADDVTLDNNGNLTIDFGSNPQKHRGLGDGGTTTMVLLEILTNPKYSEMLNNMPQQFVKISVFTGEYSNDAVADMVEGWNTNKQVDRVSMECYKGNLDWLKSRLSKSYPAFGAYPKVAYFFGDTGVDVDEVIQTLCLFAMPDAAKAYSGTGGCLSFFLADLEKKECSVVRTLEPVILQLLALYEFVAAEIQAPLLTPQERARPVANSLT